MDGDGQRGGRRGPPDELPATREQLLLALRDPEATPALLARVARDPQWARFSAVRLAIVVHRHTPLAVARNLVPHLHWRELAEAGSDARVHPLVRRAAERYLTMRLGEIAVGERVSLARRASRALITALLDSSEDAVVRSLLGNPRLVEADVLRIAASPKAPAAALADLAAHWKWGGRRAVRLALVANPRTPVAGALRTVATLDSRDLQRLSRDGRVPAIVRIAAQRRLEAAARRSGRS